MTLDEILNLLAVLSPEERAIVLQDAEQSTHDQLWVPNPGPQTDAYFCEADEVFFGGQAGGGKVQGVSNLVLTPTGWVKLSSLKIGSKVCASDGTVTKVTGIYPQGVVDLYRVTMRDGGCTMAGLDHNWLAWRTHADSKVGNRVTSGSASAAKWTTAEMIAELAKGDRPDGRTRGFAIPVCQPTAFNIAGQLEGRGNFVTRSIPAYLLGLLLGDGYLSRTRLNITSMDDEIAEYIFEASGGDIYVRCKETTTAKEYAFKGEYKKWLVANLEQLGLIGTKSGNKFIPRIYLFGTVQDRWDLLRGLMDTDGWVEPKRACYYCTVSKQLARDVAHLARSLGAVVSTVDTYPTYTHKGQTLEGQKAYALRIKLPNPEMAFSLTRKREIAQGISHQCEGRVIQSIEFSHKEEGVCIRVKHPNSLYITEDFIVTHNSDLEIGLALTAHKNSLLLRRTNIEALGLAERISEIVGHRDGWNSQAGTWRMPNGRTIDIGGCQLEEDKQKRKGKPHDLICFDEISDFTESQYTFIIGWNRSADKNQRCRVVGAGNPPTKPEGLWVIKRWAAWLDPSHPNPASPGELRWYTTGEDDTEVEVDGRGPHIINGEKVYARSRTFIPSKLSDNPDLAATDYAATLAAMPANLRAAYRDGRFDIGLKDNTDQVIPSDWVRQAQSRWTDRPPEGVPMCCIGVDVAQGGEDQTVLAIRYDGWYAPMVTIPGVDTPNGQSVAGHVIQHRRDKAKVVVDLGGGWGGEAHAHLRENGVDSTAYMGIKATKKRTQDGLLKFFNERAAAYWQFREALDPTQPQGSAIMLPKDAELTAGLCAPSFTVTPNGIKLEPKESVTKRLGMSPDKADAVIMAWWSGVRQANIKGGWAGRSASPKVVMKKK